MAPNLEVLLLNSGRVFKVETSDKCIESKGCTDRDGYGYVQFRHNKLKYCIRSHRAAYMIFNKVDLTSEDVVMHTCDNPSCINPLHLKIGTHYDNVADRVKKGRSASGERNGRYVDGRSLKK